MRGNSLKIMAMALIFYMRKGNIIQQTYLRWHHHLPMLSGPWFMVISFLLFHHQSHFWVLDLNMGCINKRIGNYRRSFGTHLLSLLLSRSFFADFASKLLLPQQQSAILFIHRSLFDFDMNNIYNS